MLILTPLLKSLVRPVLEYGNSVWNTTLKKHPKLIEDVQRRFSRKITGLKDLSYEQRLHKLNLPSLEYRRLRGDLIETYKILHGIYDTNTTSNLLHLNSSANTRGHSLKLNKNQVRTSKFSNFFTNRIVNIWNNLPKSVVLAETVNGFKNGIGRQ